MRKVVLVALLGVPSVALASFGSTQLFGPDDVDHVATGDLDGDGLPDLISAGRDLGWNRVEGGNPRDWPWTVLSTERASGLRVADLDGDGALDLTTPEGWYRNDGAGGFGDAVDLDGAWVPADLDGNGAPDLLTSDGRWARNLGRGVFEAPTTLLTGPYGIPLTLDGAPCVPLDADGDGDLDLAFPQLTGTGTDLTLLVNDGVGVFTAGTPVEFPTPPAGSRRGSPW